MADLRVNVDGLSLPNPFVIGSGPPGTNANVIKKAFAEGRAGVFKHWCMAYNEDA